MLCHVLSQLLDTRRTPDAIREPYSQPGIGTRAGNKIEGQNRTTKKSGRERPNPLDNLPMWDNSPFTRGKSHA